MPNERSSQPVSPSNPANIRRNWVLRGAVAGAIPSALVAVFVIGGFDFSSAPGGMAIAAALSFPAITAWLAHRINDEHRARIAAALSLEDQIAGSLAREETWNLLADAHMEGVIVFDAEKILAASRCARRMFGFDQTEDLYDQDVFELVDPDEHSLFQAKSVSRNEAAFEVTAVRKGGSEFPAAVTIGGGVFRGKKVSVAVVRDQSGEKRIEQALRDSERQLRHAQKMEGVGMLAAGVAHDFNNLLTVIGGHGSLLMDELEEHPAREHVEPIASAVESASTLTRQLLAFSSKQVMNPRVVDLNNVVRGVTKMLGRMIGEDIRLNLEVDAQLGKTEVDPGQVEQVIINLAVNARDAMPAGGTLTIKTAMVFLGQDYANEHPGATVGEFVRLSVKDTGVGMEPAIAGRVFEPFFTTKGGGGTGLGLATVYGIVKQSGGYIDLLSAPGRGTRFDIYLPVSEAEETLEAVDDSIDSPGDLDQRGTVLLVEDNERVRSLVSKILTGHGYEVIVTASGADALLQAVNNTATIDLLLADVVMPAMNGGETAEQFARLRPETPVLFMTGYSGNVLARHGIDHGDIHLLEKPFSPQQLINRVAEMIRMGHVAATHGAA